MMEAVRYKLPSTKLEGCKVAMYRMAAAVSNTLLLIWKLLKAMVFPVVMYGCESWTTKKAECQKIDVLFFFLIGG